MEYRTRSHFRLDSEVAVCKRKDKIMAVYYVTISLLTGLGYFFTEKKQKSKAVLWYLAASFLLLAFLASFRYAIGFDYFSYRNIYEMVSQWSFADTLRCAQTEPLYYVMCKIFSLAGCPFQIFLLFVNLFLMAAAMQFVFRYSKLPWVSVYLYVTLQFLAYNMNLIRQSIAAAFFLMAYPYLKNRKLLPYTLIIFIGGMFHNSLWFVYPLYFLLTWKYNKKTLACLFTATCLGYLFFDPVFARISPFLPARYANYSGSYFWSANGLIYVLLPGLYCLLIYLFRNRIENPFQRTLYLNSALYQFIISAFITKHFILERFAIYPFVFSLLAIPEIIDSYRKKAGKYTLNYHRVLSLFLLFGFAWFCFSAAQGFHRVYPYVSLLDKSLTTPN